MLNRHHIISKTADLTCVITYSTWLLPGQKDMPSPGEPFSQSTSHDCWKSYTAICMHLKEQSMQIPVPMQWPELCKHVWTVWWTRIGRGSEIFSVWCRGRARNFFGSCFLLRPTWGDLTGYNCPHCWLSPQITNEETSTMRPHLIAIYGQLWWFQSAAGGKKKARTLSTYNYGDQTHQPFSAMMG